MTLFEMNRQGGQQIVQSAISERLLVQNPSKCVPAFANTRSDHTLTFRGIVLNNIDPYCGRKALHA